MDVRGVGRPFSPSSGKVRWTASSLLTAPLVASAQTTARVFRIGVLAAYPPTDPETSRIWDGFFQGLRDLG